MAHPGIVALVAAAALSAAACSGGGGDAVEADGAPTTIDIADNPEGGSFRLLTYNVAGLPVEIQTTRPDLNLPQISARLNPYDIVLTQEDYDWWVPDGLAAPLDFVNYHGRLRAKATHEHQSPRHPGPEAVGIGDSRPPLLSSTMSRSCPRTCITCAAPPITPPAWWITSTPR